MINDIPSKQDIIESYELIKNKVHQTPVLSSRAINKIAGCDILFKCENFQKVGAFKYRGASNVVCRLDTASLKSGVATHSSGNHAAALALAASSKGVKSYIVMPETAPEIKKKAVKEYGAEIIFCKPTLQAREETLKEVQNKTGAYFVHPYDNYTIIAGQATSAYELISTEKQFDYILAPVGGGGLLSGTALSVKFFSENTKVIGIEPKGADDAFRSVRDNKIYPSINPKTIADGLLTSLSGKTFNIIKNNVEQILTVEESSIIAAMRLIWERMKIIIEPSSAVPLAGILENKRLFEGKKVGIIISGGNVDLTNLPF